MSKPRPPDKRREEAGVKPAVLEQLQRHLERLGLDELKGSLDGHLSWAQARKPSHVEFLERVLGEVAAFKRERRIERRFEGSGLKVKKTLTMTLKMMDDDDDDDNDDDDDAAPSHAPPSHRNRNNTSTTTTHPPTTHACAHSTQHSTRTTHHDNNANNIAHYLDSSARTTTTAAAQVCTHYIAPSGCTT